MISREHQARRKLFEETNLTNVFETCGVDGDELVLVLENGSAVTIKAKRLYLDVVDKWEKP